MSRARFSPALIILLSMASMINANNLLGNADEQVNAKNELPLLELAIGWPLKKLADHSPDVDGLPKKATDLIASYLDTPVRFHYAGDQVQFDIPKLHTFWVQQENGLVSDVSVDLLPLTEQDPEPAFSQLKEWSQKFDLMGINRFYDKQNCGVHDNIQAARRIIHYDIERSGAAVGCWQDSSTLYSLGVTRFKRHYKLPDGSEKTVPVYYITISMGDKGNYFREMPPSYGEIRPGN